MATNGRTNVEAAQRAVEDAADATAKELREFGREARAKAEDARKSVVKQLFSAAETLRKEAREAKAGKEAIQTADKIAGGLERAAQYFNRTQVDDMGKDVEREVRRNPWRALAIIFVIGVIVGLILRRGDK